MFKFCKSLEQEHPPGLPRGSVKGSVDLKRSTWHSPGDQGTGANTATAALALPSLHCSVKTHILSTNMWYKVGKFQNEEVRFAWEWTWVTWFRLESGETSAKKCGELGGGREEAGIYLGRPKRV